MSRTESEAVSHSDRFEYRWNLRYRGCDAGRPLQGLKAFESKLSRMTEKQRTVCGRVSIAGMLFWCVVAIWDTLQSVSLPHWIFWMTPTISLPYWFVRLTYALAFVCLYVLARYGPK